MSIEIPPEVDSCQVRCGKRNVTLTNLQRILWPQMGKTKRDLLLYYAEISELLLPHLKGRAVVMKRYPDGIEGRSFFMKRTPIYRPDWLGICSIEHQPGKTIDFPVIQDLASLLWVVNLGCIDLNQWYSRCDQVACPDYLHFDLDPVAPAGFAEVRRAALLIRDYLQARKLDSYPKTTGSRGIHVYLPLQRKPTQKQVWQVARRISLELAAAHSDLLTSEYRLEKRPPERVVVDYNQNAWGRTLASVYSVRASAKAMVSTPLSWEEVENGIDPSGFTMDSIPARLKKVGDLFKPLLMQRSRTPLEALQ